MSDLVVSIIRVHAEVRHASVPLFELCDLQEADLWRGKCFLGFSCTSSLSVCDFRPSLLIRNNITINMDERNGSDANVCFGVLIALVQVPTSDC